MEINLEVPSSEHEKLDIRSNAIIDVMDSADGLCVNEEEIHSPSSAQVCVPNKKEHCAISGEHAEVNTIQAVDKGSMTCDPQNGLLFETKEAAYSFYREYARSVGFGITIKASRRSKKSGKFIDVKIVCSRFGSQREPSSTVNSRSSCIKTGCKAGLHIKRTQDEKWVIFNFTKEHNHEICPDDFYNSIQGRNKQSGAGTCQKKALCMALDEDDLQVMLDYFTCMQAENPNFFYSLDLDHENRLKNVFWVDAKGRNDYRFFYDVVFFDNFYIRGKYKVPYAPFIGINNHFQFILLGCSLIGEQTASSFEWIMQTWLKAMGGQAPKVIITDQDKYLNEAVANVFPDSRHCFCLWHVLDKIPENLCSVMDEGETFMNKFNKCIYRSLTDVQFEKRWWKMVDKFELREDDWVCSLYEDRQKWVPTYMKDMVLAGISTTERCGSIASFFDKYIHKETTVKEFLEQHKIFLQDRIEMEAKADFDARNKQPAMRSQTAIEKQMSALYTEAVFKKFQFEVLGVVSCQLQKESEDGAAVNFRVDDFEKRQDFLVSWNETASSINCLCRSFEYRGFLCKHAILVLQISGISNMPFRYILKRWTKDAKTTYMMSEVSNGMPFNSRAQHFNDLCKRALKLVEAGCLCQEAYHIASKALEEILESCIGVNNSVRTVLEPNTFTVHSFLDIEAENHGMTKTSKKKKTYKKKKKVVTSSEGITIGLQDNFLQLDQTNSRTHATGNCYIPQHDVQNMEMGSGTPSLDGFYGSQPNIEGVGRLNSVSPIRDDYYSNQHSLQGLGQLHSMPTSFVNSYGAQQSMHGLGQQSYRTPTEQGCFEMHSNSQDTPL